MRSNRSRCLSSWRIAALDQKSLYSFGIHLILWSGLQRLCVYNHPAHLTQQPKDWHGDCQVSSMNQAWIAGLLLSALNAVPQPSTAEIIRRSVANTRADWNMAPDYNFTERDVVTGNAQSSTKTYLVMMIDGSPYDKLIAANGRQLAPALAAEEERKLQEEIAQRAHETRSEKRKRIAEYIRGRRQDDDLLQEMIKAIDFQLTGEDTVDGRRCFVLEGSPKPGYRPKTRDTKVLKGMRGEMWIDEQQYQWVKVQAKVFRPVAFGLFIAHVEPGTEFTLEQQPVQGTLWLPSHFSMHVKARVLRFWSHNSNDDETYWDYSRTSQGAMAATTAGR